MKKISIKIALMALPLIAIAFSPAPSLLAASPGALDLSFGIAGKANAHFQQSDILQDIAVHEDGKIVSIGSSELNDFLIARHTADGALDTTFDSDGLVTTDFGGFDDAKSVAIQSDGKIVVCGSSGNEGRNAGIARYNGNGSLDTSFDSDGKRSIINVTCDSHVIQLDGKIIGAGNSLGSGLFLFRLNLDGSLDITFGSNGFASAPAQGGPNRFSDAAIQRDGKIIAVATLNNGSTSKIARFNPNGSLDTTFSGDGLLDVDLGVHSTTLAGLAIDPVSNAIIAVGSSSLNGDFTLLAIRISSSGNLDTSFDGDGIFQFQTSEASHRAHGVAIQSDRKILITGTEKLPFGQGGAHKNLIMRLNQDGTFDSSFGNGGISAVLTSEPDGGFRGPAIYGGKLLVGTRSSVINNGTDFTLTKHNLSIGASQSGDFDGDGVADAAFFRPSNSQFRFLRSSDNFTNTFVNFGINGDIPIDGDFDGDGLSEAALFRPSSGAWDIIGSLTRTRFSTQFGQPGDLPAPGDFDRDGKGDIATFRPVGGIWSILQSSSGFLNSNTFQFGANGDIPLSLE